MDSKKEKTFRAHLKELLETSPQDPARYDKWLKNVVDAASEPVENLRRENSRLSEQVEHLRVTSDLLQAENERLRARLAGRRAEENAAQERAEAFRTLAENSPDLIVRLDRNLRHVYANPAMLKLTGLQLSEIIGRTVFDLGIYQQFIDQRMRFLQPFESGQVTSLEVLYQSASGPLWYDVYIVPEPGPDGEIATALFDAHDITQQKLVEDALRRSEERFRIAAYSTGMVFFEQDFNLTYTWCYDPRGILGASPLGKCDADLFALDEVDALEHLKRQVLETGAGLRSEQQLTTGGKRTCFEVILEPLDGRNGEASGLQGAYADISARKTAERELTYRALLLENVHDAIVAMDADWNISSWNRAAEDLFGWKAADVTGRTAAEVLPAALMDELTGEAYELLRSGGLFQAEVALYRRGHRRVWIETNITGLFDDQGTLNGYVCAGRDVSQRRELEEENERHRASLESQRALLDTVFQINPGAVAVISGEKRVHQMVNDAYRAILPYPDSDPLGKTMDAVWPPSEGFTNGEMIGPVLDEEASVTVEGMERPYPDGSLRYFTVHARPIRWKGEPAALLVIWETTQLENAVAEARRRASEAEEGRHMLEALMEYIPEGVTILSAEDTRVLYISKYAVGLGPYERDELQGEALKENARNWRSYNADGRQLRPEELPAVRATRGEVIQNKEIVVEPDGRRINLLVNAGPIRDAQGRIFASVSTARDITERKREEANARFVSELSQAMITMNSPEEVLEHVSRQLGRFLEVERCFISERQAGTDRYAIRADYSQGLRSMAGPVPVESFAAGVVQRLRRGKEVVIADSAADPLTAGLYEQVYERLGLRAMILMPWSEQKDRLAGVLGIASSGKRTWTPEEIHLVRAVADLTRLALENAHLFADLQEFRYRFDLALRSAPVTVYTTDRDLRITWVFNPRHGISEDLLVGRLPEEIDPEGATKPLILLERSVLETGKGARRELRFEVGGKEFWYDVNVEPLLGDNGDVTGLTVATMETTDLRRMEAEAVDNLAQIEVQRRLIAERELERTRIARELHDGPLQDLIAASYNLVDAMAINEKEARVNKLRAMQSMLNEQIRELRRFCNDLRPPALAPFGLEKTIRAHAEGLRELFPDLNIQLNLQRDGQRLPEEIRMTLYRVYQELANNVLRHAKASQMTVNLRLLEDQVALEVTDDGAGFTMPGSWIEFARQGHLGLVGVQERVQIARGQVEIESSPGGGTHVRVVMPR